MPAYKPEECDLLLYEAMEAGDLDSALDIYEPEAVFIVSPGKLVTGRAAIREVLQGMASAQATGKLDSVTSVTSADGSLAFTRTKGTSTHPSPDGNLITTHFHSSKSSESSLMGHGASLSTTLAEKGWAD